MRVLVVDDDPITVRLVGAALTRDGYSVVSATTGEDALRQMRKYGVRLVVTDWEMPEMDGLEFCRAVRSVEQDGYVYVILLTSHVSQEDVVRGLSAGADDFVTKPFNPAELLLRVRAGRRILSLESRDVTVFAIAKLAESRDPETGAHLDRIRGYSRILAAALSGHADFREQLTPGFIRLIYLTSPLHDIGKVALPDAILLKPGKLSPAEFEIMKTHTRAGADTLSAALEQHPSAGYLRMARDIAAHHHERWDGSGYPDKLRGDRIPLAARIVAVADVYDALVSKRVYKDALAHELAVDIITEESGTHFDPRIVAMFLRVQDQISAIRSRFAHAAHGYLAVTSSAEWAIPPG